MSTTPNMEKCESTVEQPERTRSGRTYAPPVDIVERGDELLLLADVPGADAEGIDINYDRGHLTIVAKVEPRQTNETRYALYEYGMGDFVRTFQVSEDIDPSRIEAEVSNGVLTLHLPKADQARARKISVKAN